MFLQFQSTFLNLTILISDETIQSLPLLKTTIPTSHEKSIWKFTPLANKQLLNYNTRFLEIIINAY